MTFRRFICIALVFLLIPLWGCGGATPTESTTETTTESSAVESVETTPEKTVESTPAETAESNPVETVESNPVETAESNPAETAESNPVETVESTPVETAESNPVETVESTPDDPIDITPETTTKEEPDMEPTYSVLFIGNSYTYYNDMPTAIFEEMARSMGYKLEVTAITKGAYKLSGFADPADEYGAKVEAALTGSKKYDFVILQEQSARPATDNVDQFYSAVRNLSERIRATGATPILYSTWGRKAGHETLKKYGWTNETMTWKLAAAYQAIGDELGIPVVHVGLAFFDIYTGNSQIEIYDKDLTHPSYAGSYLAAVCLFSQIFDIDPTEIDFSGSLQSDDAALLREAASRAVLETPTIPEEYRTSSEGIE